MKSDKGKSILIWILVVIIIALCVLIGLAMMGKISFHQSVDSGVKQGENDVVDNGDQEKREGDLFEISYQDDEYISKNVKGFIISKSMRNIPVIKSENYQNSADKIVRYLTGVSDERWNNEIKVMADQVAEMDALENLDFGVSYLFGTGVATDYYLSFHLDLNGAFGGVSWLGEEGYNFSIETGEVLNFSDIARNYGELVNLTYNEMVDYISNLNYSEGELYNDSINGYWKDILKDEMFKLGNWYFVSDGIKFCIPKYSIGIGSVGLITHVVSYDQVNAYLIERYHGEV